MLSKYSDTEISRMIREQKPLPANYRARVQLRDDLRGGEPRHVRVRVGVVHHLVSGVVERLYALRIFVHPLADDKERRARVVLR